MPLVLVLAVISCCLRMRQSEAGPRAVHAALPAQAEAVEASLGGQHQGDLRGQQGVLPHVLQRLVLCPHIKQGLTSGPLVTPDHGLGLGLPPLDAARLARAGAGDQPRARVSLLQQQLLPPPLVGQPPLPGPRVATLDIWSPAANLMSEERGWNDNCMLYLMFTL